MKDRGQKHTIRAVGLGLLAILHLVAFSGCASSSYTKVPRTSAGVSHTVDAGTVVGVRKVKIEGQSTNLGVVTGVAAGTSIGRTVGRGDGTLIAGAAGAVVGGIVGTQVEKAMTAKLAQEVTVEMDDGGTVVIVQELEDPEFREGDRVAVMETRTGWSRIRHYESGDKFY